MNFKQPKKEKTAAITPAKIEIKVYGTPPKKIGPIRKFLRKFISDI